jgi:hypothetical protein
MGFIKTQMEGVRRSTSNTQAQAIGGGKGVEREVERQEEPLEEKT